MDVKVGFVLIVLLGFSSIVVALPVGPSFFNITSNETGANSGVGELVNISGGYVAKMNVSSVSQNSRWKGFLGWVSGSFTLDDASGSTVYDWPSATASGEIYATRGSGTIEWGNVDCATAGEITSEDSALQQIGGDNISSTFVDTNIETYVVAGFSVGVGDCFSSNTYVNNNSQNASFEEIILFDDTDIIFATEIENDVVGYDNSTYDFQMIVPDYGNESISGNVAYYLYVELD